jgi:hypothetical protein
MPHAYVCALFEYMCASASVQDEIGKHPDVDMIGYVPREYIGTDDDP